MIKHHSSADRRLLCAVIIFVGIACTISSCAQAVAFATKPTGWIMVFLAILSASLSIFLAWIGRGRIIMFILNRAPGVEPKSNLMCGLWTIVIDFTDNPGKVERRTGGVDVFASLSGIKMRGRRLVDPDNQSYTTMNGWFGESVEFVTYDNHEFLFYTYKVPLSGDAGARESDGKFEKIGFAWARKKREEKVFLGHFRDIHASGAISHVREGTISLTYSEAKS